MGYINELVEEYNEEFVFNKNEVERMVKNGSFESLNFDEAKTLYAFSNRHSQVCEIFDEDLPSWAIKEVMTLTKGYAVSKVREYAKSLTKVVETSGVSTEAYEALLAKLASKDAEIAGMKNVISRNNRTIKNQGKALEVVTSKLDKVTTKLNNMWSLKEVQASYMRIQHGVVQKVRG